MQHTSDPPVDPARPRLDPRERSSEYSVDLAVAGMGCPSCGNRVRNALLAHPGVREAEVDLCALTVRVWYRPELVGVSELVAIIEVVGQASQHRYAAVPLGLSSKST
ncbi:MAG: cation transporter [Gemmatimonadales bacterium]